MAKLVDAGSAGSEPSVTDGNCAACVRMELIKIVRATKRSLERIASTLINSPGGAQGCVDTFSADEYTELTNMIDDLELFYNDHRPTGNDAITVTVPTQS